MSEPSEVPELPQWIQDLISSAEERAYDKGRDDGQRYMLEEVKRRIEGVRIY